MSDVALKYDQDKLRMELVSVPAIRGLAAVLTFGAKKYADHNWRKGFKWSRLYGAAMRHLMAHMDGEDNDPESGLSHLDHALCCLMFLSEHEKRKLGEDDRYKGPKEEVKTFIQAVQKMDMAAAGEGVHRRRRRGEPAGIKAEMVLDHLRSPMSIRELAQVMGVSVTTAGYWVHRLKDRLLVDADPQEDNRTVVRYVVA